MWKKKGVAEKLFKEITVKNFQNLAKGINLQIQDEWTTNRVNIKKAMSEQIIITFLKTKDRKKIMKEAQENNTLHIVEKTIRIL